MKTKVRFLFWGFMVFILIAGLSLSSRLVAQSAGQIQRLTTRANLGQLFQRPYPKKDSYATGVAAARADLDSKTIWLTNVDGPDYDEAYGCFYSVSIENSSPQQWAGITVSATFDVRFLDGIVGMQIGVLEDNVEISAATKRQNLTAPGRYSLASAPFIMKSGKNYQARARVTCQAIQGKSNSAIVVIPEIKCNI